MHNTEDDIFGTDEEFDRRLQEFKDRCLKGCCNFLRKIIKHAFATIVLILGIVACGVGGSICFLDPIAGAPTVLYGLTSLFCSFISLWFQRGYVYAEKEPESKRLLTPSGSQNKRSQMSLEHVMEPRQGSGVFEARSPYQGAYEIDRSFICEPLNSDDCSPGPSHVKSHPKLVYGESSVGTSSTPDPFPTLDYDDNAAGAPGTSHKASGSSDSADVTSSPSFEDVTYSFPPPESIETSDLDEPSQRLSAARLSAHGIRTLGAPVHVYGADKYTVFQSSDEHTFESSTSSDQAKTFEVSVEVHPVTRRQMSSSNDGSSFGEPASMGSDETAVTASSGEPALMASDETAATNSSGEPALMASDETAATASSGEPAPMASDETALMAVSDDGRQISPSSSGEPASMASEETGKKPVYKLPDILTNPFHVNKGKTVVVSVEIHPDSSMPISSSGSSSSLCDRASRASEETALTPDSDHDLPYIDDDQSSESACSTNLDEESSKTGDKC